MYNRHRGSPHTRGGDNGGLSAGVGFERSITLIDAASIRCTSSEKEQTNSCIQNNGLKSSSAVFSSPLLLLGI